MTAANTIDTYKNGNAKKAFEMFKNDPTANAGVSFNSFCNGMEDILRRREEQKNAEAAHAQVAATY